GNDLMPASCILSIASAAAAAETGARLGAIEPPLWSASLAMTDCAPDSPIEHADTALPARAVSAVFRRKSRREPFLLNSAAGIFSSSLLFTALAPCVLSWTPTQVYDREAVDSVVARRIFQRRTPRPL